MTPICQGSYSCFHVPLVSASQVPAEGRGSGRRQGCLTGAIVSRVAGKTLAAAGLEVFWTGFQFTTTLVHPFDHLVLGTPYLQFREIAAASVERSSRLFHTGSGATCSSYCLFLFGVCLLLKLISACVVAERAGSRGRDGLAFANDSCS